jgi:hypothetical protein
MRWITQAQAPQHVRPWLSPTDPPVDWYLEFSSALYQIERIGGTGPHRLRASRSIFRLTPVVNRPVYTFDRIDEFIKQSRDFTVNLFSTSFLTNVQQYRIVRGPPLEHCIYRLPPNWTWRGK